jgi:3-hydroxy-9,10-secoandrosta-1,3,5(10)-triene-9,17-dione monooxygenase
MMQHTPKHSEFLVRAEELRAVLRGFAVEGDLNRRVSDEVMDAMAAAGFFRLLKPVRFGGYPVGMRTMLAITETLGEADGSAAWLVSIYAVAAWLTGHAPEDVLEDVFGVDADARIAGSDNRVNPARRVERGLRVSGEWPYASGSLHASWAGVCVSPADCRGGLSDVRLCWIPAQELGIEETWRTVGMRATGSHSWVARDVFVPANRQLPLAALIAASATSVEPSHRLPFGAVGAVCMLGPILGMAGAALGLVIADAGSKPVQQTVFGRQSESVGVQIEVGEAALRLRTARLHAYQIADALDHAVLNSIDVSEADRAWIRAQSGFAVRQIIDAFTILLNVHGAGSFAATDKLQQHWRDAETAARHAGLNGIVGYEILGKSLLDSPGPTAFAF